MKSQAYASHGRRVTVHGKSKQVCDGNKVQLR